MFERWRNRRTKGGHDRQLKALEDWDHWSHFKEGTLGIVERALRLVIKAYANGQCALRWGLPGGKYREAAEKLKAAGFGWVKEQTFKDALRGKLPAENTIPANAPGVRELVLTLLDIWPEFKWQRLVLDPPEGWLEGCDTPLRQPAQNDENARAKAPQEPQETWKVAPIAMRTIERRATKRELGCGGSDCAVSCGEALEGVAAANTDGEPSRTAQVSQGWAPARPSELGDLLKFMAHARSPRVSGS